MYLSRVEINTQDRQKLRDLSHLGAFHNWVEQSFPDELNQKPRTRKLWRIDKLNGKYYLLVVSQSKPDLKLLERYGVSESASTKSYDAFLNAIKEGMKVRFRVTLNPVISIKDETSTRGRTKPHVTLKHQMQFLLDRAEKNGFTLNKNDFSIVERSYESFKKADEKTIQLSKVTYEGILTITDKNQFIKTLTEGFGKKKAYGFGMMTIIPEGK
ncbi:MAG: type I-E CRISPR-associated protein Cas6/Cse3/CasE [Saccharofermentanales bacterium]|nr:type I-E CRISPR-associated protein Cas6/Cse3/CasE [Clostridiaceae bacterium]